VTAQRERKRSALKTAILTKYRDREVFREKLRREEERNSGQQRAAATSSTAANKEGLAVQASNALFIPQ
jgi:hypothetical protein